MFSTWTSSIYINKKIYLLNKHTSKHTINKNQEQKCNDNDNKQKSCDLFFMIIVIIVMTKCKRGCEY